MSTSEHLRAVEGRYGQPKGKAFSDRSDLRGITGLQSQMKLRLRGGERVARTTVSLAVGRCSRIGTAPSRCPARPSNLSCGRQRGLRRPPTSVASPGSVAFIRSFALRAAVGGVALAGDRCRECSCRTPHHCRGNVAMKGSPEVSSASALAVASRSSSRSRRCPSSAAAQLMVVRDQKPLDQQCKLPGAARTIVAARWCSRQ